MRIVIIGSVAAGSSVAAKARRNSIENEIVIYEKDSDISYSVCGLPYYIGEEYIEREDIVPRNPEWFKKRFDIEIKTGHEVKKVDSVNKKIEILNIAENRIFIDYYDVLVFATGAKPVIPDKEWIKNPNVFSLRNVKSAEKIKEYIEVNNPKTAVIVGSGFIGLEMAENLTKLGIKVSIIENREQIMSSLDIEMAGYVEKEILRNGVAVFKGESLEKLENNRVFTESGKVIEADIVILAAGVKPETELAAKAGVKIGEKGGIIVSDEMRTSVEGVFAVGDCVETFSAIDGKRLYRPMGSTANKMGRVAGDVITGGNLKFRGVLGTGIVKVFELTCGHTGYGEKEAVESGYNVETIHNIKPNQTEYFEGSSEMVIKCVADRKTGRVLGVQIVGKKGVDKRVDVFATAITFGAKVEDLFHLDLAYAPPFSTTKDPVMYTGMILENALKRGRKIITPKELIEKRDKFIVIDVRNKKDFENGHIENAVNVPLEKLKEYAEKLDKSKKYVVHCNKGVTGNAAQNLLINMGFENVYNLSGGYKNYKNCCN